MGLLRELPTALLQQGQPEEPPESREETNADRMEAEDWGGRDRGLMGGRCGPGPMGNFPQDSRPVGVGG